MNDINQRIAQLSPAKRALLEQKMRQKALNKNRESVIPRRENHESASLSFSQVRMWLLDRFEPGNPAYNRPTNIHLTGRLNVPILEQSLNEIVRRHEILRTSFPAVDGQPVQVISSTLTLTLPIVELSHLAESERESEVQRLATQEAQQSFNLSQLPLIRPILVRLSEKEHILLLTLHHIIFDGWSMGVLIKELAVLYEAFSTSNPSPFPELSIQYADFAEWQQQRLKGEALKSQLSYWKKQLGGNLPILELPTDRPRGAVQTFRGAKYSLLLPQTLNKALKELSQREGVTLFMTLLAAFQTLLYRYTGQDDMIVGTPIAGRDRTETEKLIGVFINTLVLRTQIQGNLTFQELLSQVREVALGAYEHQDVPFEKLVEELQPQRHLRRTPLFQVLFQLRNLPTHTIEAQGLKIEDIHLETGIAMLDLALEIAEEPEGLVCAFKYNIDLFDQATIERMAYRFQRLLEGIVNHPKYQILNLISLTSQYYNTLNYQSFSCYLIGHESLLIPCANILLERGHQLLGIISTGTLIDKWSSSRRIPHIKSTDDLISFLTQQSFDYLFSINNLVILPKEILELPRKSAINCHDGLLPKYGGVNAPSWAILNQEKSHGITWHQMTNLVDGGDILKQISINIAKNETAFTLNGKCYESTIQSFTQLIDELASNQIIVTKQNLDERSYFSISQKPQVGCVLSWNNSAHEIDSLIRALDFGVYPNWLGLPKLVIVNEFIIIAQIEILEDLSKSSPGTIILIESDYLVIATKTHNILLKKVLTIEGKELSIPEFVTRFELHIGYQFKDIELNLAKRLKNLEILLFKHEKFWVERLATLKPITIPYANLGVSSQLPACEVKSKDWLIPDQVITALESRRGVWTLGNFLVAAFAAYLARISETYCFDLGFKQTQLQHQLAGLESFFASDVPCRINIGYEQSFEDVFEAVNQQVKWVKQHKTYARDIVLRYPELESLRKQDFEHHFSVIVEQVKRLDDYQTRPTNGLTLIIPAEGKKCCWIYNPELFNSGDIARMLEQFTTFVRSIVADTKVCLASLQLLSDDERHKVLVEWNDTQTSSPQKLCVHQLFEVQVEQTPDAIAVEFGEQKFSYKELNERANQLADYLRKLGVKPEVLVGICVERSIEMFIGILGILKAGGAYVPLDPTYPRERLDYMVLDAQVSILLTQEKFKSQFSTKDIHQVCLDRDWSAIAQECRENPVSKVTPDNLAYVIYTSGSTGKPKGVMIEHQALVNFTQAAISEYGISESDRVLQFASISFDTAAEEIYPCLTSGGTLVLRTDEMLTSVATFLKACQEWKLTVLDLPTAYWQQIVSELATTDVMLPESLRLMIIGGERALPESVKLWQKCVGNYPQLVNTYGPTEGTIVATTYKVTASTQLKKEVPIGRAIANCQTYILDKNLQPVPIGIPGELYIGGTGLARGYLNRPELTQETFIANPFSKDLNSRLYKTGDRVRYLSDGNIEFIGRIDNQVKIRGFRIELGEIEAVLSQHLQVSAVVVIAREDQPDNKRLVAYFVSNSEQSITDELRSFLKIKLPDYMLPSAFVQLDKFPLTPNGKVDCRALAQLEIEDNLSNNFVPPRNSTEAQLAAIWSSVLGIKHVGIDHNFFELGGHSLLATKVLSMIQKTFEVELPLRYFFEASTIAELAQHIETIYWVKHNSPSTLTEGLEEIEL